MNAPSTLDIETEKLNAALVRAEETIRGLRLGVSASVPIAPGAAAELRWGKRGGEWGLLVVASLEEVGATPVLSASREKRILAAKAIPTLVAEMRRVEAAQEAEAHDAGTALNDWLDRVEAEARDTGTVLNNWLDRGVR